MPVGVLALQGDVREHLAILSDLGESATPVRSQEELASCTGLVIPGGESTTISKLLVNYELLEPVRKFVRERPVLGTCAGLILLSDEVVGKLEDQQLIGGLAVAVERNAYGGQTHSFEAEVEFGDSSERVAFIRAPRILDVGECEVIATYEGEPVAVRDGKLFGATFHPELTGAKELHRRFLSAVQSN
ncbi:MAG: pyridoxal 5'-phosphate synthase glutaminase subunit PdxT [Candidatus Aquiluna sp. XM-24bin5]|nr:MAG: pyridoxal 5'-phosphate synthase glutaminase subunit PdxT [Candidatus Aquiluna sp. XM-24bin5]